MSWIILIVAGLFESAFAFCLGKMKGQAGIEYYMWGAGFIVSLVMSMPIGTAYPVWTGIGAVGTVVLGIAFLHEPVSAARIFFIVTLIGSVVGLKMS